MIIKDKIYTIRNLQVMLDSDLAMLYGVETKVLNQAVKRNIERFPIEFCFQLNNEENTNLKSQFVTSSLENNMSRLIPESNPRSQNVTFTKKVERKYLPHVFTEQGVAMLAGVLKSDIAIKISIQIINAFVVMRKIITENNQLFVRLDTVERKLITTDQKIEKVLKALSGQDEISPQKLFFDNRVFDAHAFVSKIIRSADKNIILIDNFIDDSVLSLFIKRKDNVEVTIYTKKITREVALDLKKFNDQYSPIEIREFDKSHDRFLIIDGEDVYHFGASLKDLGKKWFVVTKLNLKAVTLLGKLSKK